MTFPAAAANVYANSSGESGACRAGGQRGARGPGVRPSIGRPVNTCDAGFVLCCVSPQLETLSEGSCSMTTPLSLKAVRLHLATLACILFIPLLSRAESVSQFSTGLTLTVEPSGRYSVQSQNPPFRFGGDVGSPLSD